MIGIVTLKLNNKTGGMIDDLFNPIFKREKNDAVLNYSGNGDPILQYVGGALFCGKNYRRRDSQKRSDGDYNIGFADAGSGGIIRPDFVMGQLSERRFGGTFRKIPARPDF